MDDNLCLPVSQKLYCNNPDYFCVFKPKIHRDAHLSDNAILQCQMDIFGPRHMGKSTACINTRIGNYVSLVYPHCLRERLPVVAYLAEAGFILDDVKEALSSRVQSNHISLFPSAWSKHKQLVSCQERIEIVLSKTFKDILAMDASLGKILLCQLNDWKHNQDWQPPEGQYTNLGQYLLHRYHDAACSCLVALGRFAGGSTLSERDEALVGPTCRPLYSLFILTNDYFSWDKERKRHVASQGRNTLTNAVGLYMQWHSLSCRNAKAALRATMGELQDEYLALKSALFTPEAASAISDSARAWVDTLETIVAGNWLWSMSCPRYKPVRRNPYRALMKQKSKSSQIDCL
ncbi:hypothetical protein CDD81_2983 [Ophiocordyceps australis]|uniref:Terpene synthase n=1 Tax=Ophiocordyceps australis TaxID=1399860 RepID=A0A2C5YJN9_9HYPO|nr:hypothetical protein CDD81_2983 [Ophiocordyceps australis]